MDSRDKRASAVSVALPWRGLLPVPDGSLNQGDRQQAGLVYRGIAASNVVPVTIYQVYFPIFMPRRRG